VKVEVRLFATLAAYLPAGSRGGAAIVELPEGTTVAHLARRLGIPDDLALVALVNDREAPLERALQPGDVVTLFPPLAGGAASGARRRGPVVD
jgi:molybdopterin converting factor small subunit